jgi:hypothetical protein
MYALASVALDREEVIRHSRVRDSVMAQPSTPQLSLNQAVIGADLAPIKQIQMARFDVEQWRLFGSLITGRSPAHCRSSSLSCHGLTPKKVH